MALSSATFAFLGGPFASNGTSQTDKIKHLQDANSISSTNNKWSISSHKTLVSNPFKDYIHPTGKPNFAVEDDIRGRHERKLEEMKQLFKHVRGDSLESLAVVDALQRLAIDYHFEDEIEAFLQRHFLISTSQYHSHRVDANNLHEAALRFRLLRQGGYPIPSDVFQRFLNKMNGGTEKRKPQDKDILGLTSLFEASHLGTDGEDVLDEVRESTGACLHACLPDLDHLQARFVRNSLGNPFHKSLARFTAGDFLRNLAGCSYGWTKNLGELAHLDMNIARSVHQREILQISNWWEELGIGKELKYARDPANEVDEFQDGRDGSYVECYKQEFQGSSDEAARDRVKEMITEAWKRLNKACLRPQLFAKSFTRSALNTARMVRLMYNYDDNHSLPIVEHYMKSLLFGGPSF
uniref:Terpene synthase n=1 Tax=Psidium guajava TaxID=120290 RepID=A0AA95ZDY8_PSIGU|nr:terpene synthase [Psidium guajava]